MDRTLLMADENVADIVSWHLIVKIYDRSTGQSENGFHTFSLQALEKYLGSG